MKRIRTVLFTFAFLVVASSAWATGGATTTTRATIDVRLESAVDVLSDDAARMGDAAFAERLGAQFGVSADVLTQQRTQFNAAWGDLVLAHSIAMMSRTGVTVDQIFGMRADGLAWTEIARTHRVPPGRLITSVRTQVEIFDTEGTGGVSGRQAARDRTFSRTESRLNTRLEAFEVEAARIGDQAMAERLGAQFGVSASTLLNQKTQLGATWSDLLIAHTVAARTRSSVTVNQILTMRASGRTWSEIASSLRLPGGRLLSGVNMETRALFKARGSAEGAARLRERSPISVRAGKVMRGGFRSGMRSDALMRHGKSLSASARAQAIASAGGRHTMLTRNTTVLRAHQSAALRTNQSAILRANVRAGLARTNR